MSVPGTAQNSPVELAPTRKAPPRGLGPNWRRLWLADTVSSLGDGAYFAAIPLLALSLTKDPGLIAGVATFTSLPWLLCSLHAGALADRYDRKRLMWIAQLVQAAAVTVVALTAILPIGRIWILYVTSFALGTAETVFSNSAQSMLPSVVDPEQLEAANGRQYATETVTQQFVGPPLGSLLFVSAAASLPFWLDAVSFLVSALLIARVRLVRPADAGPVADAAAGGRAARPPIRKDIAEGLRWLAGHKLLRTLALMLAVTNMAGQLAFSTMVLFATVDLHVGTRVFGVLLATSAVGGVAGGLCSRRVVAALGTRYSIILGTVIGFFSTLTIGVFARNAYTMGACLAVSAFSATLWNVATVSMRQRIIPDRIRGRVNSVYRLAGWGSMPIGAALGGAVAGWLGLRAPWLFAAGLRVGVVLAALLVLTPALFEQAGVPANARVPAPR